MVKKKDYERNDDIYLLQALSHWLKLMTYFLKGKILKKLTRSHLLLILDFVVFRLKSGLKFYIAADTD